MPKFKNTLNIQWNGSTTNPDTGASVVLSYPPGEFEESCDWKVEVLRRVRFMQELPGEPSVYDPPPVDPPPPAPEPVPEGPAVDNPAPAEKPRPSSRR
jgi:hypothetical protein